VLIATTQAPEASAYFDDWLFDHQALAADQWIHWSTFKIQLFATF